MKKNNYTLILIYTIILVLFIWNLIREYNVYIEYHDIFNGNENHTFNSFINLITQTSAFRTAFFSLPIAIGILYRTKIGWILVTLHLYFIICNIVIQNFGTENQINLDIWLHIIGLIFLLGGFIFFMNQSKTVQKYHKINDTNKKGLNLIAFTIGILLSITLAVIKKSIHF